MEIEKKFEEKIKEGWNLVPEDVRGIISGDITKILVLITIFIISFMILTYIPQITFSYVQVFSQITYFALYLPIELVLLAPAISTLGDIIWILFHFVDYLILNYLGILVYSVVISIFVIIAFWGLSTPISFRYKVKRTRGQNIVKILIESVGVGVGIVLIFYMFPFFEYSLATFGSFGIFNVDITIDLADLTTIYILPFAYAIPLWFMGGIVAIDMLVRIFFLFLIVLISVFIVDSIFWIFRKLTKQQVVSIEEWEYYSKSEG